MTESKKQWHQDEAGFWHIVCRTCGAWGSMYCSTVTGRDHITRVRDSY